MTDKNYKDVLIINSTATPILSQKYGDFLTDTEVVQHPHFEVPYPQLKRGQQTLGALVAVVRSFRYIYSGHTAAMCCPSIC